MIRPVLPLPQPWWTAELLVAVALGTALGDASTEQHLTLTSALAKVTPAQHVVFAEESHVVNTAPSVAFGGVALPQRASGQDGSNSTTTDGMSLEEGFVSGRFWIATHGGTHSDVECSSVEERPEVSENPLPSGLASRMQYAHRPLENAKPHAAVYIFGDLFTSLVSSLCRRPELRRLLKGQAAEPVVKDIPSFFDTARRWGKRDPAGVRAQFEAWSHDQSTQRSYAIVMTNRAYLGTSQHELSLLLGTLHVNIWSSEAGGGSSSVRCSAGEPENARPTCVPALFSEEGQPLLQQFDSVYGDVAAVMQMAPPIVVALPRGAFWRRPGALEEPSPLLQLAASGARSQSPHHDELMSTLLPLLCDMEQGWVATTMSRQLNASVRCAPEEQDTRMKAPALASPQDSSRRSLLVLNARLPLHSVLADGSQQDLDHGFLVVVPSVDATTLRPTSAERALKVLDICSRNDTVDEWKLLRANPVGAGGPEDPKVLTLAASRRTLVIFNHLAKDADGLVARHMFLHDVEAGSTARVALPCGTDQAALIGKPQKNWSPFERGDGLYFVFSHAPRLRILRVLDLNGDLPTGIIRTTWVTTPRWATNSCGAFSGSGIDGEIHGGTPFSLWRWPLFVSMAHARMQFDGNASNASSDRHVEYLKNLAEENARLQEEQRGMAASYALKPVLAVMNVESWEVHCSLPDPFPLQPPPPPAPSTCREQWRSKSVRYPHSLIFPWDGRGVLLGAEFEDRCPAVVEVPLIQFAAAVDATLYGQL